MRYVSWSKDIIFAFAFTLILVGCAQATTSGLPTPDAQFSDETTGYVGVVLVVLPGGTSICSGTFVSPIAVLTAAHCALDAGTYQIIASFGSFTTTTAIHLGTGAVDDVSDIALLILTTPAASAADGQVYNIGNQVSLGDTVRLVGYGCNDLPTRSGAGIKRTGTNVIYQLGDYIEFLTPGDGSSGTDGIIGPDNRAGSCFGDSGSPGLKAFGSSLEVVGVTHAGGTTADSVISEYVDIVNNSTNRSWLSSMNTQYSLGIQGI